MHKFKAPFETVIFVCNHKRPDGHPKPCCADRGGKELRDELRNMVRAEGLEPPMKVFISGCLGGCEHGPTVLKMPDGELMFGVTREDLPGILEDARTD